MLVYDIIVKTCEKNCHFHPYSTSYSCFDLVWQLQTQVQKRKLDTDMFFFNINIVPASTIFLCREIFIFVGEVGNFLFTFSGVNN